MNLGGFGIKAERKKPVKSLAITIIRVILTILFYPGNYWPMPYTAFSGFSHIASGGLADVYRASQDTPGALIFDEETGRVVDIDPRFPPTEDPSRSPHQRPGRPKLGVVAREVTLLPRHWDWLASQPGGASVALRKLVEEARRDPRSKTRMARDSLYRLSAALVGNAPGFEEAIRALYAGEREEFIAHIEAWPQDVRAKLEEMADAAFG